jgi:RNA polymerase subunit RPABC4/transcription elongation factor Spt4
MIPSNILLIIQQVLVITGAFVGAFLVALWVSIVIWTFRDIRSRSRDIFAHLLATLMVVVFFLPGLLLYYILRPQETLVEAYERSLEEEALLQEIEEQYICPGCRQKIETDFVVCPSCHTKLKQQCANCGRLLHLKWNVCPYCGQ